MSCVHQGPTSSDTRSVSTTARLALALPSLCGSLVVVLIASAAVASAPRTTSAQATPPAQHTVRHTLRGEVGTVTQVEISSPWRPSAAEREIRSGLADSATRWMHRASVRSNVRTIVTLEPAPNQNIGDARELWHVIDVNGQLVPWQREPIVLSRELDAGRHEVPIVWVAPPGATSPPNPVVRLRPVTDAR
jgi:hypothetical protein